MRKVRSALGLKAKVVLALAIVILTIQTAFVVLESRTFQQEQLAALRTRTQLLANLYAGAITSSVWEYNPNNTRDQLIALQQTISEFESARVYESTGVEFVSVGAREIANDSVVGRAQVLNEGREIAWIDRKSVV